MTHLMRTLPDHNIDLPILVQYRHRRIAQLAYTCAFIETNGSPLGQTDANIVSRLTKYFALKREYRNIMNMLLQLLIY